ncbi:hypothetical protein A3H77_00335 [Candidatus Kaiserbacteria bacterium RIFCSPLOWO2_02_FULL_56_11]|uniref:Uncharacterized protein n=2 Tax=Candidatus Kaiseribacteriota TaxID=1752734 RepID=A0A1F6E3K8_9BACT|nr:MAG: hypothetical protein A3C95_02115 [Candidatus Kaiserbacteria bacterium RIFCSPHIGHO2_02_FULL_56_30]OGG71831.1 MAG: hypothetical protein A3E65_02745 [Candidatus Kaiserbacteria bacterium RIFCSPHIGHO2_12_FULL_56_13]OGG81028.1 MAG: hypothetical protein A3H77_00335 [Candidatus Kaiserbacteria bacterium RIFCSPLOWO2_02_FULL_56_11]
MPLSVVGEPDESERLLHFLASSPLPGSECFVASEHFNVDWRKDNVQITFTSGVFREIFLKEVEEKNSYGKPKKNIPPGKIEKDIPPGEMRTFLLQKPSTNGPIIHALGQTHEIHLADLWAAFKKQPKGEVGTLATNNETTNVSYIRDIQGQLWAIRAYWYGFGEYWRVEAYPRMSKEAWPADSLIVSR